MEIDLPWHQPDYSEVERWEFQAFVARDWVDVDASPIGPCPSCFQATLDVPEMTSLVRSRSIGTNGKTSEWSTPLVLPEPDGLLIGVLFVALLSRGWFRSRKFGKRRSAPSRGRSRDASQRDANASV